MTNPGAHRIPKQIRSVWNAFVGSLNFYRIHILFFTIVPLITAAIFYGANGEYKIPFVDALFMCYSAVTGTGLTTIDLSTCTPFQQVLLLSNMFMGGLVSVSWVMVYVRRRFFHSKFEHIVNESRLSRTAISMTAVEDADTSTSRRRLPPFLTSPRSRSTNGDARPDSREGPMPFAVQLGMIRRVGSQPQRIDPSGKPSQQPDMSALREVNERGSSQDLNGSSHLVETPTDNGDATLQEDQLEASTDPKRSAQADRHFPRSQTVGFREPTMDRSGLRSGMRWQDSYDDGQEARPPGEFPRRRAGSMASSRYPIFSRQATIQPDPGFGGFPGPHEIVARVTRKLFPGFHRHLSRTVSMALSEALPTAAAQAAPYLSFEAYIGRNSKFHDLTNEQLEELGGVEYRALSMLLWLVGGYWIMVHSITFAVIAISATAHGGYDYVFAKQYRYVNPVWFSLFQAGAAFSNAGMSLVDESMIPFSTAYAMILVMTMAILGGNTAFPVLLRFLIWLVSKCIPSRSRAQETVRFLLDHPRRCFVYLFPSSQTYLLLVVLIILNSTDWIAFGILDIGTPEVEAIPIGNRVMDGLFQSISVRTAGFVIVSLANLSPAVRFLYMIMMYISAYPIAMSVRSTNVYEEKSMGVFNEESGDTGAEPTGEWRSYLAWHIRKQLAFDIWWLFFAIWLVCIIERGKINDPNNAWIDIFPIMFEVVSGYGTNGLSLGVPYDNFSLSGAFSPLSKIIIMLVMLRGRHRGLPVAIDRAVVLPYEFAKQCDENSHREPEMLEANGTA